MRTTFYIERSPVVRFCSKCKNDIKEKAFTARKYYNIRYYYFHFICYDVPKQYIYKEDIEFNSLDSNDQKTFILWLNKWNKKYIPIDEADIDTPVVSNCFYSKSYECRRIWLEILKFIDGKELFMVVSYINKDFLILTYDDELWYFNCIRDYGKVKPNKTNYREQYILFTMRSCFWCHNDSKRENSFCTLFNKSICRKCRGAKELEWVTKQRIKDIYGFNPNLLELKFETLPDVKCTYRYIAENAIISYRNRIKSLLLDDIKKHNINAKIIDFVEKIDVKNMNNENPDLTNYSDLPSYVEEILKLIYKYLRSGIKMKAENKYYLGLRIPLKF